MVQDSSLAESDNRGRHDLFPARLLAALKGYHGLYHKSIERREEFWRFQAGRILWDTPFDTVVREDWTEGRVEWFPDGKLNACHNVLGAQCERGRGDRRALLFLDETGEVRSYTYREMDREVRLLAAAMKKKGLKPGDRVALYLPDSPETLFFLLACSFLGLVPVPIPIRYTAELTREILLDCSASLLAVSLGSGSRSHEARAHAVVAAVEGVLVVNAGKAEAEGTVSYAEFMASSASSPLETPVSVEAEHPFFILYANTAAGVPRGSLFATGGFLVQAAASYDYIFASAVDGGEVRSLVCLLDLASAAGLCYGVWGPLANGSCIVIAAEGTRTIGERLRLALETCETPALLAAPTQLADLKRELDGNPISTERRFALVAASGDVLKPRQIQFAAQALVSSPERVLNLWIQSECGASVINTFPSPELNHAGVLGLPFPGIEPQVINYMGKVCRANESGQLVFRSSWPSMIRSIYGQDERYRQLYFQRVPGYYSTNDGARVDGDGFFWFMGRLDDVIKVRGQSLATSEVEAVLTTHPLVSEAAVVSAEDEEEQSLVAFLVLDSLPSGGNRAAVIGTLEAELDQYMDQRIGEFAHISQYVVASQLPRTRTGKVVRRVLKRIVSGDISIEEDLSHLANPDSVEELIRKRGL